VRIVFANGTHKWGGVKTWTLSVAEGLIGQGHQVLILARPGTFLHQARALGCATAAISFGPDYNPAAILRIVRLLRCWQPDVLCGNVGKDLRTAGIAARLLGIPVIHRIGLAGDVRPGLASWLDAHLLRPHLVAPCQEVLHGVQMQVPALRRCPGSVIRTGKKSVPRPPKGRTPIPRLVSASQLTPDKDHATALYALGLLRRRGLAFHYDVYGTGPLAPSLAQLASRLGIADAVTWHGFVTDVPQRLVGADIFLLPSTREGLPNALLEAMAAGLVCVARDVGGIKEVWPQGAAHLLLTPQSQPEDMAKTIIDLILLPPEEFDHLRRAFWESCPSWETMIHEVETLCMHRGGIP